MSAASRLPSLGFALTVVAGENRGASYVLASKKISIGRSETNDIVLNDPKCSREHATIEITNEGPTIFDLGSQHGMKVNGQKVTKALLKPGSVITIGATALQLAIPVQHSTGEVTQVIAPIANQNSPLTLETPAIVPQSSNAYAELPHSRGRAKNNNFLYIVVGLILLGAIFYSSQSKKTNSKTPEIRTDSVVDTETEELKHREEELLRLQNKKGQNTQPYKDAQAAFIKGFRAYREGNFKQAMLSFSAAMALYPDHELAQRYYRMAQRQLDGLVQYSMLEGKRYVEQNQYKRAMASYRQAMYLIDDPNNKTYQEARARYQELDLLVKGTF